MDISAYKGVRHAAGLCAVQCVPHTTSRSMPFCNVLWQAGYRSKRLQLQQDNSPACKTQQFLDCH